MATSTCTIQSERLGQTILLGSSQNMDSAVDWSENFRLPAGFGDCIISGIHVGVIGLQTVVVATPMRGPIVFLIGAVTNEFVPIGEWRRQSATAVAANADVARPILWRAEELLNVAVFSEDTGAGDTSDMVILARVMRLRNQA